MDLQVGDCLDASEVDYVSELESLWDMVSNAVENGELSDFKERYPKKYKAIVRQMMGLVRIDAQHSNRDD